MIVHFETKPKKGDSEDFKINWKDVETSVRLNFNKLKIVYSRADQYMGELALSSHNLDSK